MYFILGSVEEVIHFCIPFRGAECKKAWPWSWVSFVVRAEFLFWFFILLSFHLPHLSHLLRHFPAGSLRRKRMYLSYLVILKVGFVVFGTDITSLLLFNGELKTLTSLDIPYK